MTDSIQWPQEDPMMDELHRIRREIQQELKGKTDEEVLQWYHDEAVKGADQIGYDLVPSETHPGAYRMVHRASNDKQQA